MNCEQRLKQLGLTLPLPGGQLRAFPPRGQAAFRLSPPGKARREGHYTGILRF